VTAAFGPHRPIVGRRQNGDEEIGPPVCPRVVPATGPAARDAAPPGASPGSASAPPDADRIRRRLRIGLMLDGLSVRAWERKVVDDLARTDWIEMVVAVVCWSPAERKPSWVDNLRAGRLHRTTELYDLYESVSRRYATRPGSYAEPAPLGEVLQGVDILHVVPHRTRGVFDRLPEADIAALRRYDLDVLLRFGFRILKGAILTVPRHGVWSYHHGDPTRFRGGPSCFWEIAQGERSVGVVLQRLTESLDAGEVLYRSTSSCAPTLWVDRVREPHYLKSARFVLRSLELLHRTGSPVRPHDGNAPPPPRGQLTRKPGNLRAVAVLGRMALRTALANGRHLCRHDIWSIMLRQARPLLAPSVGPPPVLARIVGKGWQTADPCLFSWEDRLYCFFERVPIGRQRGEIAVVRVLEDGQLTEPQSVLTAAHHLSYPFLFVWDGRPMMLVESADSGALGLFEADAFPLLWRRRATLLDGQRAYDPTLLQWEGLWYLFVAIDEAGGGPNDELFVFVAETPLGPWQPHALNPVVSDCRSARPAGALFVENGTLIRPAQDCSGSYGRALNLCAIDRLTPEDFAQRVVGRIEPASVGGSIGCHTLSRAGGIEAIDLRRRAWRWPRLRGTG
jgi:hypothetical protein